VIAPMLEKVKGLSEARIAKKIYGLTVGEAAEIISRAFGLKDYEVARLIYDMKKKGLIILVDPNPPNNFIFYLFSHRSAWFWCVFVVVILTLLTIFVFPQTAPFIYLRYVLGSVYVLFVPGYVFIEALYPRGDELSQLERFALSIGLSLAIVPLVGLVLNYTPWGIRLEPICVALTALIYCLLLIGAYRKYGYYMLSAVVMNYEQD